jgi:alcohol dehydrogenase
VLIIGAGPIGLATLEFTRLTGAKITVMDMVPQRLEFVRRTYGIESTVLSKGDGTELQALQEITAGDLFAVVTDATGHRGSMSTAFRFCAHTGTLVYVGITTEEISFTHPTLHRPEITLKASRNALPKDFRRIIQLIESGTIDTKPWITHRVPFSQVPSEFESFTKPDSGVLKAMIDVSAV